MKTKQAKTKTELEKARSLIKEVFIDEIGLDKSELEKYKDQDVDTYILLLDNEVISTVRAVFADEVKLDWIATKKEYRGRGYAKQLVSFVLEDLSCDIFINSHIDVVGFYEKLEFEKIGDPKPDESGELHVRMSKRDDKILTDRNKEVQKKIKKNFGKAIEELGKN